MLVKDLKRLVFVVVPAFGLLWVCLSLWRNPAGATFRGQIGQWLDKNVPGSTNGAARPSLPHDDISTDTDTGSGSHHEVYSVSTPDGKFFPLDFAGHIAISPNIVPHPTLPETWIMVAQQHDPRSEGSVFYVELVCNAVFATATVDGSDGDSGSGSVLRCVAPPTTLPIAATTGSGCTGELDFINYNVGPHDARIFWGPRAPFALYGSNSGFTCFGQWIQDLRVLVDWGVDMMNPSNQSVFRAGTEIRRPAPFGLVEKNWFVFWDRTGQIYAHYDVAPHRSFARLAPDGTVGWDLAPLAAVRDDSCLARYLPKLPPVDESAHHETNQLAPEESIHQATNSLAVTLCRRADPHCRPTDANTFIFVLFHHKKYYDYHSVYEPYAMLFRQREPFEIYAISQKPVWFHGRGAFNDAQSQMFYVASMSWKTPGQKYHGYLDDVLFVAFGIEDKRSGAIDVRAGDLLAGMGLCTDP